MFIQILGSAAGGGFPQWNCNCVNCAGLRNGSLRAKARTQSSIAISDNGKGISPEIVDKLFLPFVTDKQAQGGTGLGLSVTYGLVQAHGGDISFDTRQGKGTTFTISLPTVLKGESAKILIVDDDQTIRAMLTEALTLNRSRPFLIEEASNGIEASVKLGTFRPDLLILDIFMPEMDGLAATGAIRKSEKKSGRRIPIIALTAHASEGDKERFLAAGLDDYVAKPLKIEELVSAIDRQLGKGYGS